MFQRKLKLFFIDASSFVSTVMVADVLPPRIASGRRTQLAVALVLAPAVKTREEPVHRLSLPFITVAAPTAPPAVFGTDDPLVSSKRYSASRPSEGTGESAAAGPAARGTKAVTASAVVTAVAMRVRSLRRDGCFAGVD